MSDLLFQTCQTCYFKYVRPVISNMSDLLFQTCQTCYFKYVRPVISNMSDLLFQTCQTCYFKHVRPVISNMSRPVMKTFFIYAVFHFGLVTSDNLSFFSRNKGSIFFERGNFYEGPKITNICHKKSRQGEFVIRINTV